MQKVREGLKAIRTALADYLDKIPEFDFAEFKRDYVVDNPRFKQRKTKLPIIQEANSDRVDYSLYHKKFPILLLDHGTHDNGINNSRFSRVILADQHVNAVVKIK